MAVDLEELVEPLKRMISPPGSGATIAAADVELVGYLSDGFWTAKLDGFFPGYTESDGMVDPESGDKDLPRDWQQLIVFYAGAQIVENQLRSTNTGFRTKAGPVEYEVQNSAQLLREHLASLNARRLYLLELLSTKYNISPGYVDMIAARTNSILDGRSGYESGIGW